MKSNEELVFFDKYGILRFNLGGKILLLFITEIIAIWVSFMLIARWRYFSDTKQGLTILISNTIFLSVTFLSIVFKRRFIEVYHTEMAKQISNILYFVMIFLIIYYYTPSELDSKIILENPDDKLYFYTNPVMMSYVFILIFMICFYIIYNSQK